MHMHRADGLARSLPRFTSIGKDAQIDPGM